MSDKDRGGKSVKTFTEWLTPLLGILGSAVAALAVFVKITPFEIDTAVEYIIGVLFVVFVTCVGVAAWSHWHRKDNRRRTAMFGALAVAALVGGVLMAIGAGSGAANGPSAAGSPTISTSAPTTVSSTTVQGDLEPNGSDQGSDDDGRTSTSTAGGVPSTTGRSTGTVPNNPTQPDNTQTPSADEVRYQGDFRLSASQESLDLDPNPPQAYGTANELAVDDHAIWTVPPHTTAVTTSGSPTRAQCADAVSRANPPAERFDNPQPGDAYCVRTSDGRYALVRVASAATKDFTLTLTVWN